VDVPGEGLQKHFELKNNIAMYNDLYVFVVKLSTYLS
jgi:hypothetical protein